MLSSGPPTVLPSYFLLTEKPAHLDQFNKISMDYKQYFYIKRHFFNYAVAMRGTMQEKQGNNFDSMLFCAEQSKFCANKSFNQYTKDNFS